MGWLSSVAAGLAAWACVTGKATYSGDYAGCGEIVTRLGGIPPYLRHADAGDGPPFLGAAVLTCLASDVAIGGRAVEAVASWHRSFNKLHGPYPLIVFHEGSLSDNAKDSLRQATEYSPILFEGLDLAEAYVPEQCREHMYAKAPGYEKFSVGYKGMCRFYSGGMLFDERDDFSNAGRLLRCFKYYWRIDSDARYPCEVERDLFLQMRESNFKYGYEVVYHQHPGKRRISDQALYDATLEHLVARDKGVNSYFTDVFGNYNFCQLWTNFEIVDVEWLSSKEIKSYFNHLDNECGFYKYRWGDAPVRSLQAAAFLDFGKEAHAFEIGYIHESICHCPCGGDLCARCSAQTVNEPGGWHKNFSRKPLNHQCHFLERKFRGVDSSQVRLAALLLALAAVACLGACWRCGCCRSELTTAGKQLGVQAGPPPQRNAAKFGKPAE